MFVHRIAAAGAAWLLVAGPAPSGRVPAPPRGARTDDALIAPPRANPSPDPGALLPPPPPPSSSSSSRLEEPSAPKQRGVALGLFSEDVGFSYVPLLREIAGLGATHVSLVVPLYQSDVTSSDLALHTRFSPTLELLADTIRAARREHLEVTVFPIVRLLHATSGEWRGTLAPRDRGAWFRAYGDLLGDLAAIAAQTGATRLAVASELSSLDGELTRWRPLVERIRAVFPGKLLYSANWDHYRDAKLFDLCDEDGVVAYFRLRESVKTDATDVALEAAWRRHKDELLRWHAGRENPLVLTELGYRSRAGSTIAPWDETEGGTPDLDEQRRGFAAFRKVWSGTPGLAGAYVWNWYGWGGPRSVGYTPRGKPAEAEIRKLLADL